ncbi:MAG: glycine--tRNA ligase [Bacilli bacterium]|nr:glycine--tRNA ligase [Bacilli bacterium]
MEKVTMEKIVNLCKQYGFIFQGSEIYDGLANTWDYGPVGVELKNNVKKLWWKRFVQESPYSYGIDASILMNPKVWEASGHVSGFQDPLLDCKECKARHRADKLIENYNPNICGDAMSEEEMVEFINEHQIPCPVCGKVNYTGIRQFNLMFKTNRGVTEDSSSVVYLRPETAQGEYVNFLNVQRTMRLKVPFGIGQIGKAFRNEITPGNFTFRTIEFEQMEHQFFIKPGTDSEWYEYYKKFAYDFFTDLGLDASKLRFKDHEKLVFYANAACDIEYDFPFGWGEIYGNHSRTNYDLTQHTKFSGKSMEYLDPETNEKYIPYVVESSCGCDRLTLALLCNAFFEEKLESGETREVMRFSPAVSPYKVAVLPLMKKYHSAKAMELYNMLSKHFMTSYDESGNIGKRYRRQDVIGTPMCITVDENTLNNGTVTVRDRDTMEQITLGVDEVVDYVKQKIVF